MLKRNTLIKIVIVLAVLLAVLVAALAIFSLNAYDLQVVLAGEEQLTLEYGTPYEEAGATAKLKGRDMPKEGLDLSGKITVEGTVDTSKTGVYTLVYTVRYAQGDVDLTAVAKRTVVVVDTQAPEITLVSDPDGYTYPGKEYVEEGFRAVDGYDGDITHLVERTEKDGVVTYRVKDAAGNETVVTRKINYNDPDAPVITLQGNNPYYLMDDDVYSEPGYSAYDACDGDLTDQVEVTMGEDAIIYRVTDAHGNETVVTRAIARKDITAPVITLLGEEDITITIGTKFVDPGFTATDDRDGDLTAWVEISGSVHRYLAATYTLTYTVRDASGNETTVQRTVVVEPRSRVETVKPEGKVIYLTFDDGPSYHTSRLLEVLAKYDVKATFFVVDTGYYSILKDIVDQGHAIGIHSCTHNYKEIYASEEAYFADVLAMQDLIYQHTGVITTLVRFPGGGSNTVSGFNPGIMRRLTKAVQDMGFQYFDWNVDSQDAGGAWDKDSVVRNVINGCSYNRISVVLQHDIKGYSVDAVEEIILWGLANGYTFLPLDPTSPTMHHGVNN